MGNRVTLREWFTHGSLFVITIVTTAVAGVQWLNKDPFEISNISSGLPYAFCLLLFLSAHELGHYFAARLNRVSATLPYFLPFPSFLGIAPFGTFGAVIRLRERVSSRKVLLDISTSGPLAGYAVCLGLLAVGFLTLPGKEYLLSIHPEYARMTSIPEGGLRFGGNLTYLVMEYLLPSRDAFIPPMNEIYHYPLLCTGWFGLFVTSLNLIPVGQLDGGHIARALFGNHSRRIATVAFAVMLVLGAAGMLPLAGVTPIAGWTGWIVWALILFVMTRRTRLRGDLDLLQDPMGPGRTMVGTMACVVLVATFTPSPILL